MHPDFERERAGGGQEPPTSLPLSPTSQQPYAVCDSCTPCRKGTIYLQISMPSTGIELRLNDKAVSVTIHYTG
ncbi:hypothetical protein TNCV_2112661 [Trichonephila clavipes]|nr:hypothetical protein TNCV_2112661 [Trichonephila clavipes]